MTDYEEDFEEDENEDGSFSSAVWLLKGITGSILGYLELENDRLVFTIEGRQIFDVPLSQVSDIVFPWYYFGGGVKFRVGENKYRLSFVEPNSAPGYPNVGAGRDAGKIWRSLLDRQSD